MILSRLSRLLLASTSLLLTQSFIVHAAPNTPSQQVLSPACGVEVATNLTAARPFYAIAHRVLTAQGVRDAVKNGANAIEIDMTAWSTGWWADHDGTAGSAGDEARKMFETVAEQRRAGKTIVFVWLDIKNPDYCDPGSTTHRKCSVAALRDLAREILLPNDVNVLYGFSQSSSSGKAYRYIRDGLGQYEGININGEAKEVREKFEKYGPDTIGKRIMSYGYYNLPFEFGDCYETEYYTCTELRMGKQTGAFGQVFGWTSAVGQTQYVDKLLGTAGIDGLIYGFKATYYYDHPDTRQAAQEILSWVRNNPSKVYLATQQNSPW